MSALRRAAIVDPGPAEGYLAWPRPLPLGTPILVSVPAPRPAVEPAVIPDHDAWTAREMKHRAVVAGLTLAYVRAVEELDELRRHVGVVLDSQDELRMAVRHRPY